MGGGFTTPTGPARTRSVWYSVPCHISWDHSSDCEFPKRAERIFLGFLTTPEILETFWKSLYVDLCDKQPQCLHWEADSHMGISKGPVGNVRAFLATCHSNGPCKGCGSNPEQLLDRTVWCWYLCEQYGMPTSGGKQL